jgi:hypothetical protein
LPLAGYIDGFWVREGVFEFSPYGGFWLGFVFFDCCGVTADVFCVDDLVRHDEILVILL